MSKLLILCHIAVFLLVVHVAESGSIAAVVKYADETWNCNGDYPMCPTCKYRVKQGQWQNPYGCAPYVAHCLAAGGYIPSVPVCGNLDQYANVPHDGNQYNLNVVSQHDPNCGTPYCLTDYLMATGWKRTSNIKAGTVCAVVGSDGPYCHVVLGVGDNICNAHNSAAFHVSCDNYSPNLCLDPPDTAFCTGKGTGRFCDVNDVVECHESKFNRTVKCDFTCIEEKAGEGFCAVEGSCKDTVAGYYCGNDKIGAPTYGSVLFQCTDKAPQGTTFCPKGCQVNPGADDTCIS